MPNFHLLSRCYRIHENNNEADDDLTITSNNLTLDFGLNSNTLRPDLNLSCMT